MTPQESELVGDLFDRLAKLESLPRDPAAERLIAEGAQRAPHALYALVQTALLQDEALKRANARIEELQARTGRRRRAAAAARRLSRQHARRARPRRAARLGAERARGGRRRRTVARPRAGGGYRRSAGYQPQMPPPGYGGGPAFGTGGSFLGTAASTAAGVLGGALLLDGIRSMFGHNLGGASASPFGRGDDRSGTYADREQDRQQDLADDDREQDRATRLGRRRRPTRPRTRPGGRPGFCQRRRRRQRRRLTGSVHVAGSAPNRRPVAYHFRSQEHPSRGPAAAAKVPSARRTRFHLLDRGRSGVWNKRCEQEP